MSIGITGSPGTGKHTVAKGMAERLGLPVIDINIIGEEAGLFEKDIETNDVDTMKLGKVLKRKISGNCIIVGHLAPYVLEKSQVEKMIILRRDPYQLVQVYRERDYSESKIRENAGSEVLGVIAHDALDKFQEKAFHMDASDKTIRETVNRAISHISKGGSDEVDWLGLVTKNNDLEKFFAD